MSNEEGNDTSEAYLARVIQHLRVMNFHTDGNITYKKQAFEYIAKRTRFEIEKFGFATTSYLFARFHALDMDELRDFSAISFKYAEKTYGITIPRIIVYSITCFPVAIVDTIDNDTAETIRSNAPPKHFAAFEMPVVYSLASGALYYCAVTPMWGYIYYDLMRHTINNILSP